MNEASSTSVFKRAEELDALDATLPFNRRDQLANLEAWCALTAGAPLPWPAPEALLLKFVARHLSDPARRDDDPAHRMPAAVDAGLTDQGLLRVNGRHAPATVRRLTSWSIVTRWRELAVPSPPRR